MIPCIPHPLAPLTHEEVASGGNQPPSNSTSVQQCNEPRPARHADRPRGTRRERHVSADGQHVCVEEVELKPHGGAVEGGEVVLDDNRRG